jgi:hypothetical protein
MLKLISNKIDTYLTSLWRRERYLFSVFRGILPAIFRRFSKKLSTSVVVHQTIFYQIIKINKTQLLLKYFLVHEVLNFGIFKFFLRICWIVPKKYLLLFDQHMAKSCSLFEIWIFITSWNHVTFFQQHLGKKKTHSLAYFFLNNPKRCLVKKEFRN